MSYFANESGTFDDIPPDVSDLTVQGSRLQPEQLQGVNFVASPTGSATARPHFSRNFRSILGEGCAVSSVLPKGHGSQRSSGPPPALTKNSEPSFIQVKVMLGEYDESKKKPGPTTEATYLTLLLDQCNVDHITAVVQTKWKNAKLRLFTADGNEIESEDATSTVKFWNKSAQKIFAVEPWSRKRTREVESGASAEDDHLAKQAKLAEALQKATNAVTSIPLLFELKNKVKQFFNCAVCREVLSSLTAKQCCQCRSNYCTTCIGGMRNVCGICRGSLLTAVEWGGFSAIVSLLFADERGNDPQRPPSDGPSSSGSDTQSTSSASSSMN